MNRTSRRLRGLTLAAALLASLSLASAQNDADPPAEAAPLYRIEVIVFVYNEADPREERLASRPVDAPLQAPPPTSELDTFDFEALTAPELADLLVPDPSTLAVPDPSALVVPDPSTIEPTAPTGDATGTPGSELVATAADATDGEPLDLEALGFDSLDTLLEPDFRYRLLDPSELTLGRNFSTLQRVDAYTPLVHGGWIQEGLPENEAKPFDLALLGKTNPTGTLRLHVSRFLHVTLDLDYRRQSATSMPRVEAAPPADVSPSAAPPADVSPSAAPESTLALAEISVGEHYRLRATRRVRDGELNYFDHPYLGVLVTVEPYEPEPASSSAPGPAA